MDTSIFNPGFNISYVSTYFAIKMGMIYNFVGYITWERRRYPTDQFDALRWYRRVMIFLESFGED